jgi:hypothetical protein
MHPTLAVMLMDAQRTERERQARAFRVNAGRTRSRRRAR